MKWPIVWASLLISTCLGLNHVYFLGSLGTISNPSQVFAYRSLSTPSNPDQSNSPVVFQPTLNDGITTDCDNYNFGLFSNTTTMGFAFGRGVVKKGESNQNILKGFRLDQPNPSIFQCTFDSKNLAFETILGVNDVNSELFILTSPNQDSLRDMKLFRVELSQFLESMNTNRTSFECKIKPNPAKFPNIDDGEKRAVRGAKVVGTVMDLNSNYYYIAPNTTSVGFIRANVTDPDDVELDLFEFPSFAAFSSSTDGSGNFFGATSGVNQSLIQISLTDAFNSTSNTTYPVFKSIVVSPLPKGVNLMAWDVSSKTLVIHSVPSKDQTILFQIDQSGNSQYNITLLYQTWTSIYYYSGKEATYCPNACQGNGGSGTCLPTGICQCGSGWTWDDCSQCDSGQYCNRHGVCSVNSGKRTCQCVSGYGGSSGRCDECWSSVFCSNRGTCDATSSQAVCNCNKGFDIVSNCSVCSSDFFCNGNGQCNINGTCACNPPWSGPDCSLLSNLDIEFTIRKVTYATEIIWLVLFALGLIALFMRRFTIFKDIDSYTAPGIQMSLLFYQSVVLLSDNVPLRDDTLVAFQFMPLCLVDVRHGLSNKKFVDGNIWVQSMSFLPKIFYVLLLLFLWNFGKLSTVKGSVLRIALWTHFAIIVSVVRRIADYNCAKCSPLYSYSTTFIALIFLILFFYLIYKLWRVVAEHEVCFGNTENDYVVEDFPTLLGSTRLWKLINYTFTPWSIFLSYSFNRLFDPKKEEESIQTTDGGLVEESSNELETPVDDIIIQAAAKIDHNEEDVGPIITMLKGNWYNTVADLRTLSALDAKKLNIPYRLYKAIQLELPQVNNPKVHTALDSLVKTIHKEYIVEEYGCLVSDFRTGYQFFKMDELLIRNLVWAIIDTALYQFPLHQMIILMVFQLWWIALLLWNRPYKSKPIFVAKMVTEICLFAVIVVYMNLPNSSRFYSFLVLATINILVLVASFGYPLLYTYLFTGHGQDYNKLNLRNSVNPDPFAHKDSPSTYKHWMSKE